METWIRGCLSAPEGTWHNASWIALSQEEALREDLALTEEACRLEGGAPSTGGREQAQDQENAQSLQAGADVVDEFCDIVLSVLSVCHWTPPMSQAVVSK